MTGTQATSNVGVIGLGRMGGPIAARLAGHGHRVVGFDAAGTAERAGDGVEAAGSAADVAAACEVVALSLPRSEVSIAVVGAIADQAERRTTTIVDLSTIGLTAAADCARIASEAGLTYVDAPLSGGVAGATTGKMAMMASAPTDVIERVRPLLKDIAQNLFVVGTEPGHGQAMKLLNNYVSGTALAATFEAVVFGQRVGLDIQQIVDVLNVSSGRTTASTDKLPRSVVPGTYDFGFASEAMRKDMGLYLAGAAETASPRQLAEASDALWQRYVDACPDTDFTYLHHYLQDGGS